MFERGMTIFLSPGSDDLLMFINQLYFDFTNMLTVCIHGLGTTVNILSSL